jgi:TonB family protein
MLLGRRAASDGTEGEGGAGGGSPDVPDLRPSEDMLERVVGGGSVDKLDGVEAGENTGLNTVKWKHASFFNRVKRMVAQNWEPWKVYQARDPNGNVYGHKTKVTRVKVSMKASGVVTKIHVVKGSGVDFLDDEAVRAFRAAGPFPNPPMALLDDQTNLITFQFSFHVEIGKDSGWKIFRHR